MFRCKLIFLIAFSIPAACNIVGERRKNVVFIIVDDLRTAISEYGDNLAKTPNIDDFMKKSFYFSNAFCQQALCAPSRNSMLTSRLPDTLGLYDFYSYWRDFAGNFTTLPQFLKENGYETYSIGKIFHPGISSNYSDDYPLSWSKEAYHPSTEKYMNSPVCPDGNGELKRNLICPIDLPSQPENTLPDIQSVEEAIRFLSSRENVTNPFFLGIGFHKPHIPFRFPNQYMKLFEKSGFDARNSSKWDFFKPNNMPNVAWNPFLDIRKRDDAKKQNISFPFGPIPNEFQTDIRLSYYASVSYIDDLIGKLWKNINFEDTIVILTSDHGWSLGEHAEWAKYSNFDVATRVPLIIYSPDFKIDGGNGKKIPNIVELLDIFPTLVDLIGLPRLEKCISNERFITNTCTEGESLYNILKGINSTYKLHRYARSQYPRPGEYPTFDPDSDRPKLRKIRIMGYSMRTKVFRYTSWIQFNPNTFQKDWSKIYGEELYDHRIDPMEKMNLIDRSEFNEIRRRLRKRLKNAFK